MPENIPLRPLHQLINGETAEVFALFTERHSGFTKEGKPYFLCKFGDLHRKVTCMIWSDSTWYAAAQHEWTIGQAYRIRLSFADIPKYGMQIEVHYIRPVTDTDRVDGFDLVHLVPSSRFDLDQLWSDLIAIAEKEIQQAPVRQLVLTLFAQHESALREIPATDGRFYPFLGGWLEHVVSVTRSAIRLTDYYLEQYQGTEPKLNRDLVVAGALLHDLGRAVEYRLTLPGIPVQPTIPGKLFGHVILARDLVKEASRSLPEIPEDFLSRLEHLILSHLTLPEWGSPRLPMIPEVLILHHADDLDAKLEMYLRCLRTDTNPGPFTTRDGILNKPLLK